MIMPLQYTDILTPYSAAGCFILSLGQNFHMVPKASFKSFQAALPRLPDTLYEQTQCHLNVVDNKYWSRLSY